jgi:2-methylcitrate dehydratase PrpD
MSLSNDSMPVAVQLAKAITQMDAAQFPAVLKTTAQRMLLDITGICVSARNEGYVNSAVKAFDDEGASTLIGHTAKGSVSSACVINGIASHGEDFDDTYEGGPVHAGAVIIPALLAAAEKHHFSGPALLKGIAVGVEVMCRMCAVAPTKVHKAGFHPTAVFGAMGATAGIGAAMNLSEKQLVDALGIAGSMSSGIIEYLTDGAWNKRIHPGWAAQSGYRAARLGQQGFMGPRTVFEGDHGFFFAFARTAEGNFDEMMRGFGEEWRTTTVAFKPYACGTMIHPFIDCARQLRDQGLSAQDIDKIECETAEGILHRLWEPLQRKQTPANGYSAKFSIPFGVALGIVRGSAGLSDYTEASVKDAELLRVSQRVSYVVDPQNPYPKQFTGHVRVHLKNGRVLEARQGHFRGGVDAPLSDQDLRAKYHANCVYGGWSESLASQVEARLQSLFEADRIDLSLLQQ